MPLFFGTKIHIGINVWLGALISQLRGLRQGDPLSPLMFNLTFEPLLRTILVNNQFRGVSLHPVSVLHNNKQRPCFALLDLPSSETTSPTSIKFLRYADDLRRFSLICLNDHTPSIFSHYVVVHLTPRSTSLKRSPCLSLEEAILNGSLLPNAIIWNGMILLVITLCNTWGTRSIPLSTSWTPIWL